MKSVDGTEFMNRNKFTKMVESAVVTNKMSYIDAMVHVCDATGIDPEDVKKFVGPVIKDKIEGEAMSLNLLPRGNTLIFE